MAASGSQVFGAAGAVSRHPQFDVMDRAAMLMFLAGCVTLPMIVVRIAGATVSDVFFVASALFSLSARKPKREPQGWIQLAIGIGLIGVLVASTQTVNPSESISVGLRVLYIWTLWQWVARKVADSPERINLAVAAYCIGAAISAGAALAQLSVGVAIPGSEVHFGRAPGLQNHANGQGGVLAVALPLATSLLWQKRYRVLGLGSFCAAVMGLILCASVTGMICGVIGFFAVLVMSRVTLPYIAGSLVTVGAIAFVVMNLGDLLPGAQSPLTRLEDTTGNGTGESTLQARLNSDAFALNAIAREPYLGVGLDGGSGGTFNGVTLTHNMLLLSWFQGGLLFIIALAIVLLFAARELRAVPVAYAPVSRVGLSAAYLAAFCFAMTGPVLFERWFWFPAVMVLALSTAGRAADLSELDAPPSTTAAVDAIREAKTGSISGAS